MAKALKKPTSAARTKRTAKVFMSGASQAVRLPQEFRFDTDTVSIRREGKNIVLSPLFKDWDDYLANAAKPSDGFGEAIFDMRRQEPPIEERESFD